METATKLGLSDPIEEMSQPPQTNGRKAYFITRILAIVAVICLVSIIFGEVMNAAGTWPNRMDTTWLEGIFYAVFTGWLGAASNPKTVT